MNIKEYCKKHTHRYCQKCGSEVEYERHKEYAKDRTMLKDRYSYYCPICDENMLRIETYRKDRSKYINFLK